MNEIRKCQKNIFLVSKQFSFKLSFISIQFFVCTSIIGISTISALSSYPNYLEGLQKLNDSEVYHKKELVKIFVGSHEIAKEKLIKNCGSR